MPSAKDFVFVLLTLTCISPIAGEEQVYPEAKEWPKFEGFEWGMSEFEFYEASAVKNLERWKQKSRRGDYYFTPRRVRGKILGKPVEVSPDFENYLSEDGKADKLESIRVSFTVSLEEREVFFNRLLNILTKKYGPAAPDKEAPKRNEYTWGAPGKPHIECLTIFWRFDREYYRGNLKTPNHAVVGVWYNSKPFVESLAETRKKIAAEKRELEKKAKEDEKDF